ncbi:MAG: RluA family pseudouridine synthase [Elusimicrobiota bacterium]
MTEKLTVTGNSAPERLDVFLSKKYSEYSRGYFQRLIKSGNVLLNGETAMPSRKLEPGDSVSVEFVEEKKDIEPENIALEIIYEDADLLIVNKSAGLVVHPACGNQTGTLLNALFGRAGGKYTPLMVHRLDKGTSGIIVIAKNERAKKSLVKQFQKRAVKKTYLAAVKGAVIERKGYIEAPLGRAPNDRKKIVVGPMAKKDAITEFTVIRAAKEYSLLEVRPLTGRTHQIRSHLAYIGHPVLGDGTYGGPETAGGYEFFRTMLHAYKITFMHPSKGRPVDFTAPLPKDMVKLFAGFM